ncbi:hypothetical protein SJY89_20305 [Bacillus velezensis]|uniref:hypothetical protein n=1 Tax=Bacillus TaxID=1386 RepID=UPI0028F7F682|nr:MULTISPECIES: hypothetical protein [Bacillus]MDU0078278.1 hypothetical protein [Bacillus sp. IG2]MDU0103971.1 hypothetical protein [Bacillus sp. IS1]MDX7897516.1 hypothetical protein [Bacillus velezensis]MDX8028489.1 hypothetical protein [Bacillus velezensis]MDX8201736.1 hypothetical protein [Bacillus velezensis]
MNLDRHGVVTKKGTRVIFIGVNRFIEIIPTFLDYAAEWPVWDEIADIIEGTMEFNHRDILAGELEPIHDEETGEMYLEFFIAGSPILDCEEATTAL